MEYNSNAPIYMQVMRELKKLMIKGELKPGQKMPSNRDLAVLFKPEYCGQSLPGNGK